MRKKQGVRKRKRAGRGWLVLVLALLVAVLGGTVGVGWNTDAFEPARNMAALWWFGETNSAPVELEPDGTPGVVAAESPEPAPHSSPLPTTSVPGPSPTPIPTPTPPPHLRYLSEKHYMLALINQARRKAGVSPVEFGDNHAAQVHADNSLANCFSSHWGIDGLKPYMRYSLAGGYQSNGENGSGSDYCIKASDGYSPLPGTRGEIRLRMASWMDSQGHRRTILDPTHRKVNIGLAWDRYNMVAYQHFEGDYLEYTALPRIEDGILSFEGHVRNGAKFDEGRFTPVAVSYDPPPHNLTRGQVSRTYCYAAGRARRLPERASAA